MPISLLSKPIVALTMGDPSGIGPEIILKALAKPAIKRLANYIIIGDAKVLRETEVSLKSHRKIFFRGGANLLDLKNVPIRSFSFGKDNAIYGKASIEYIEGAYGLIKSNIADCVVTAPINKTAIKKAGFKFPGHTEYLASLSGVKRFVMMLVGGPLRVSLVTRHIPLSKVPGHLTSKDIALTIEITLKALERDFNISEPRIGVCALNPHAGESGIFGKEETKIISPAVRKFKRVDIVGPVPADALFYDAYRGKFDSVICLYHDQGLIPLKMIARDSGVNVTLGLEFVRTSPDHGTAFDIAGKGKANSSSMEEAIKLAVKMVKNRKSNAYKKRY